MRNVDKLRGAENQIDALKRRLEQAQQENAELHGAMLEIQAAMDAVIVGIVQENGVFTDERPGERFILIRKPDVAEAAKYDITVRESHLGPDYRKIIVRKKEETKNV